MPSDRSVICRGLLTGACLALIVASGCARSVAESSLVDSFSAPEQEFDYWDGLEATRILSNNDALHGLLLLGEGTAPAAFDLRLARARERGWLPESGDVLANESARTGMIAVAVCDILALEGGLSRMIFAERSPRYCTRELVYEGYLPYRVEGQAMSGGEFLDLVSRVQATLDERATDAATDPGDPSQPVPAAGDGAGESAGLAHHDEQAGSEPKTNPTNP